MKMQSVHLIGYFIVSLIIFESCVLAGKLPLPDEPPGIDGSEDFAPEISEKGGGPPFGEPKLGVDDFDEYEELGAGFIPPEDDYTNTIDNDFGKDLNKDIIPEKNPDDRFDRDSGKKADDEDDKDDDDDNYEPDVDESNDVNKPDIYGSNDIDGSNDVNKPDIYGVNDVDNHKPDDDDGSGESFDAEEDFGKPDSHIPDEHPHEKDFDEPHDHDLDESIDVEDRTEKPIDVGGEPDDEHIDEDMDKDADESPEDSEDDDDFKNVDLFPPEEKDAEEVPTLDDENIGTYPYGGFIFETPFFNMRQVSKYFQQLEKALEQVFRQSMEEATLLNGTYANTTEEEIEIDGKKYLVQKSIIKGKDNSSSIYIEALSKFPKSRRNETKEEKDSGM